MTPQTRVRLAELAFAVGAATAFGVWFFAGELSWFVIFAGLVLFAVLLVLGSLLSPPFWWGVRKFTTPFTEPLHSASASQAVSRTHAKLSKKAGAEASHPTRNAE